MNWTTQVQSYLHQRRLLGYQLFSEGKQLINFAAYAEQKKTKPPLTVTLALEWAGLAPSGSPIAMARRASLLRPFSRYLSTLNPTYPILPTRLMGPTHRRLPPFIYPEKDIVGLMSACDSLFSTAGLRPITMRTLIGLLAATGLRPGEGIRLQQDDIDWHNSVLIINSSKGWKHRMVPVMACTLAALKTYQSRRDQLIPCRTSDAFFVTDRGVAMDIRAADYAFGLLRKHQKLYQQNNGRHPRLYDLRHTFVCRRLIAWYEMNESIDSLMPQLAQYLGHKKVSDTYWYIQSISTLMHCAAARFERHHMTLECDK